VLMANGGVLPMLSSKPQRRPTISTAASSLAGCNLAGRNHESCTCCTMIYRAVSQRSAHHPHQPTQQRRVAGHTTVSVMFINSLLSCVWHSVLRLCPSRAMRLIRTINSAQLMF
jgi:hypothetical protein